MEDDISVDMAALSVDGEDDELIVEAVEEEERQPSEWCLLGRFLMERPIHFQGIKHTLASLMRPTRGMQVKDLTGGLYLFRFFHEMDRRRLVEMSPWTFNNQLLLLEEFDGSMDPRDLLLYYMPIWVQVHGLRRGFMTEKVVERLGTMLGGFMASDPKNFLDPWNTYIRIRKETKLRREGEEGFNVSFIYERLPGFYFICGLLGYGERFCLKWVEGDGGLWRGTTGQN